MAVCVVALWVARQNAFGPLPMILRGISGLLLPIILIFTFLGLWIWPPVWDVLKPFGFIEIKPDLPQFKPRWQWA
jgi:hypothetical protein